MLKKKLIKRLIEFETKFDKLTSESLKKPKLRLTYNGSSLDGQVIILKKIKDKYAIPSLSLENIGDRVIGFPSINLYFTKPIDKLTIFIKNVDVGSYWQEKETNDNLYVKQFQFVIPNAEEDLAIINPKEVD